MPDNFDDEQIDNMSINKINELYEDTIETPDEYRFLARAANTAANWTYGKDFPGNYYNYDGC